MTIVDSRFILPDGAALADGTITYTPTDLRRGAVDAILMPQDREVIVSDGIASSPDLVPGPYNVRIEAGWFLDNYLVVIGPSSDYTGGRAQLADLIEEHREYEEPVVSAAVAAKAAAESARDAAQAILDDVEGGVVPDAAVAGHVTETGSATRAAITSVVTAVGNATYAPHSVAADVSSTRTWEWSDWLPLGTPVGATAVSGFTSAQYRISADGLELRGAVQFTAALAVNVPLLTFPADIPDAGFIVQTFAETGPVLARVNGNTLVLHSLQASAAPKWVAFNGIRLPRPKSTVTGLPTSFFLPVIRIDTEGGAPVDSRETYRNATYTIDPNGHDVPAQSGTFQIRGRGNSTWDFPKKPYKIKPAAAVSMLGMPAFKDWALIANWIDPSMIRGAAAFHVGEMLPEGLPWTPRSRYCEVILNGAYLGAYQMMETVKAGAQRMPLTLAKTADTTGLAVTGDYMLEIDQRWVSDEAENPATGFKTAKGVPFIYDDPDGSVAEQAAYIKTFVQSAEDALFSTGFDQPTGWRTKLDEQSFIDWYLVNELLKNQDSAFFSSCKCYKRRDTADAAGKLHMGPLWDFDASTSLGWITQGQTVAHPPEGWRTRGASWYTRLFEDPYFSAAVAQRWTFLSAKLKGADGIYVFRDRALREVAAAGYANARRWGRANELVPNAERATAWLEQRIAWIDAQFGKIASATAQPYSKLLVNLCTNPSITKTATGWSKYTQGTANASVTRVATGGMAGDAFLRSEATAANNPVNYSWSIYPNAAVAVGVEYAGVVWVRTNQPRAISIRFDWRTASAANGSAAGQRTVTTAGEWTKLTVTGVAPEGTISVNLVVNNDQGAGVRGVIVGDTIDVDNCMIVRGAEAPSSHADGDSPNGWWTGEPHASTSVIAI